jgi:glycosyltransferase involved in cell wall biosynthesis
MRKKRILFLTEATYLNTGYATYSKQIIQKLVETGRFDVAEFSIYGHPTDSRRKSIKWKNYANMPDPQNEEHVKAYTSHPINQFGMWRFERVCLDFEPDCVFALRDFWMDSFVYNSPYRRIFSFAWMPTVDGMPQNEEWIDVFNDVDYVPTYSLWAKGILDTQSGGKINTVGPASPSAPAEFVPMNQEECRKELGLPVDAKIIGMVARNQRRKLFPVLIKAFSRYLKETGDKKTYLYLHTSFPDSGWNLGQLIHDNEVSSRVIMSYVCEKCGHFECCYFNDARKQCLRCGSFTSIPACVATGLDNLALAKLYNCFDLYLQIANSEGFGVPAVEALSCGIPTACTNYSAMTDFVNRANAIPIEFTTYKELETGCERAVPNEESIVSAIRSTLGLSKEEFSKVRTQTRELFEKNFSIQAAADIWIKIADECEYADWKQDPVLKPLVDIPLNQKTNTEFMNDLCGAYLTYEPHKKSYMSKSILRDLNRGSTRSVIDSYYISEFSPFAPQQNRPINREILAKEFKARLHKSNIWEQARIDRSILIDGDEEWL